MRSALKPRCGPPHLWAAEARHGEPAEPGPRRFPILMIQKGTSRLAADRPRPLDPSEFPLGELGTKSWTADINPKWPFQRLGRITGPVARSGEAQVS